MPHDLDNQFYLKQTKDMVNLVQRLVADGKFVRMFFLNYHFSFGLCYGFNALNLENLL